MIAEEPLPPPRTLEGSWACADMLHGCRTGREDPRLDVMLAILNDSAWIVPLVREHASQEALQANEELLAIVDTITAIAPARLKPDHVYRVRVRPTNQTKA